MLAGGGLFMDLGSHAFDLLDHWFGPIVDADAHAVTEDPVGRVEDEVSARFTFESGAHGVASLHFSGRRSEDELVVIGSRGSVSVPLFADGPVVLHDADGEEHREAIAHPPHVQQPLIEQVVNALRGAGEPCVSTGISAARTQGVLDTVLLEQRRQRAANL